MSTAATARILGVAWSTAARWIARGSLAASRWNRARVQGVQLRELQFDEVKIARVDNHSNVWIYTGMEVWSRLWLSSLTGTRTYWNTYHVVTDAISRGTLRGRPFVTTDGMKYYRWAVGRALHGLAIHAVVEKRFKNGRPDRR